MYCVLGIRIWFRGSRDDWKKRCVGMKGNVGTKCYVDMEGSIDI